MPIRRSRKGKARRPRRVMGRGRRRMGGPSAGPSLAPSGRGQYASIVETINDIDGTYNPNQLYAETLSLALFARARSLATQFQFYRAKKVTYTYEPLYNTFQQGSPVTKPYIYMMMNRTQLPFTGGLAQLQASGARPKPFTSLVKLSYTPNWCSSGLVASIGNPVAFTNDVASIGIKKEYGWLACPTSDNGTNADVVEQPTNLSTVFDSQVAVNNNVPYNGHVVYIDQTTGSGGIARLTIQVHWEFKGAHFSPQKGSSGPPPSK